MTRIDGKTPNSMPKSVKAAIERGVPKHLALAKVKPKSSVKVGK